MTHVSPTHFSPTHIAILVPGALTLAGWGRALPWGHLGEGPRAPTLTALTGVDAEDMIDHLFNLSDQSMPKLCRDGALRPLLRATLATMIMYYSERSESNEMSTVLYHMREAYKSIRAPGEDPHSKLVEWGDIIRCKFDVDNLHLSSDRGLDGQAKVISVVQQVGTSVAGLHARISQVADRQARIEGKIDQLITLLTSSASPAAVAARLWPSPAPAAATTPVAPAIASSPVAAAGIAAARVATAQSAAFGSLQPSSSKPLTTARFQEYELAGKSAGQLYLDYMANGGVLFSIKNDAKGKRSSDARKVCDAYDGMASTSEKRLLKDPKREEAEAAKVVRELTSLLVKCIKDAYKVHATEKVGARFGLDKVIVSTIVDNVRRSDLKISEESFKQWRAGGGSASGSAGDMAGSASGSAGDMAGSASGSAGDMAGGTSASVLGKRPRPTHTPERGSEEEESSGESGSDDEEDGEDYGEPCSPPGAGKDDPMDLLSSDEDNP